MSNIGPYNRRIFNNCYHNVLDLFLEMLFEIDIKLDESNITIRIFFVSIYKKVISFIFDFLCCQNHHTI